MNLVLWGSLCNVGWCFMGLKNSYLLVWIICQQTKEWYFYEFGVRKKTIKVDDYVRKIKILTNFFERENNCKFFFLSLEDLTSSIYENISYESQFNSKKQYKENFEIISPEILDDLSDIEFKYLFYEK